MMMMLSTLFCIFTLTYYAAGDSYTSTGITSFEYTPLDGASAENARVTQQMQLDCGRKCLKQCADAKANFCFGFSFETAKCVLLNNTAISSGDLIYRMANHMNAAASPAENCMWNYSYEEISASYRQFTFDGVHYALYVDAKVNITNAQCKAKCSEIGFGLASIHSVEQNEVLGELAWAHGTQNAVHIGLYRSAKNDSVWYWSDGTHFVEEEALWLRGEPNNSGWNEDCTVIFLNQGFPWNDAPYNGVGTCLCARPIKHM